MTDVIDIDSHVWEPEDIWERFVPAASRSLALEAFSRRNGDVIVNGAIAPPLNRTGLVRQAIWHPGCTPESLGQLSPGSAHPLNPGAWDPRARLSDMDQLGVSQSIVVPTLFLEHFPLVRNSEAASVLASAYNDWAADFASQGDGRLHAVGVLPLQDIEAALVELDRVAERGMLGVVVRPMFHPHANADDLVDISVMGYVNPLGVFPLHPVFLPLWERIEELGLVACIHPSLGVTNPEPSSTGSYVERVSAPFEVGHTMAEPVANMQDNGIFLQACFFHGLLEDHPALRIAILHSGASWLPLALEKAETYLWLTPSDAASLTGQPLSLEPEEVFAEQNSVISFDGYESAVARLVDPILGEKGAWGSRYPHHDATSPAEALAMLEQFGTPPDVRDRLMAGNARATFGL